MLPCDCWKAHRNCKTKIPSCPSASHNICLCVAQAEIQSSWEAEEQFGVQYWTERLWVSLQMYPLCCLCKQIKQKLFWETSWCMRIKYSHALFWCDADITLMTTKERTWKTSEELGVFYLFTCKILVSAVSGNESSCGVGWPAVQNHLKGLWGGSRTARWTVG